MLLERIDRQYSGKSLLNQKRIIELLQKSPYFDLVDLEYISKQLRIPVSEIQQEFLNMMFDLFAFGASTKNKSFDAEQLQKGIKVELQNHTRNINIAEKLAKDNLASNKNYYK